MQDKEFKKRWNEVKKRMSKYDTIKIGKMYHLEEKTLKSILKEFYNTGVNKVLKDNLINTKDE